MIEFTNLLASIDAAKQKRFVLWRELEAQKQIVLEISSKLSQLKVVRN